VVFVFRYAFRELRTVPSGVANLLEASIVFLRDEVVLPNMGEAGRRYLPYLLTVFFFILFCNLLGLIPFAATATGNISVTAALALMSLIIGAFGDSYVFRSRSRWRSNTRAKVPLYLAQRSANISLPLHSYHHAPERLSRT
jgi:F0F1-type ATP synthase membrane subunit a